MSLTQSTLERYSPRSVYGNDVNDVYRHGWTTALVHGKKQKTRNGYAWSLLEPFTSTYERPQFRVLFDPRRDANPFFHFFESLWMIAGRNDLRGVSQYVASMANYSDNDVTLNGAYGFRWREAFGSDQVMTLVNELRSNPGSRRCVLQMWDTQLDLDNQKSKDLCCNLLVKYRIINDALHASVMNRSNDLVFGAYGANVFHFSFLQEYMADLIGVDVGAYHQISTDAHVYDASVYGEKLANSVRDIIDAPQQPNPYLRADLTCFSLSPLLFKPWWRKNSVGLTIHTPLKPLDPEARDRNFVDDVNAFLDSKEAELMTSYAMYVMKPMFNAYRLFKNRQLSAAISTLEVASKRLNEFLSTLHENDTFNSEDQPMKLDLFEAGQQWLTRRLQVAQI